VIKKNESSEKINSEVNGPGKIESGEPKSQRQAYKRSRTSLTQN